MSNLNIRCMTCVVILHIMLSATAASASAGHSAEPIRVTHAISIRTGNWLPLPAEELRRAAGDAALSRLTDAGRLLLLENIDGSGDPSPPGSLELEVALIGPAETVKLTITLDVAGSPTLISTASISVRALDHAGIYDALVHVGERAADRLVAKLDLLQDRALSPGGRKSTPRSDPARRKDYDRAQEAKRVGQYAEARVLFEAVVASGTEPDDSLRLLAEDELRYGLPIFEAQQAFNILGAMSLPGHKTEREEALSRAEHLFRQIQAENPSSVQRVSEAQLALDRLLIARGALANAMRAVMLSRVQSLRFALIQFSAMEDGCPNEERMLELISESRTSIKLDGIVLEGDRAKRYQLSDSESRTRVELLCSDQGVDLITPESPSYSSSPAAYRLRSR